MSKSVEIGLLSFNGLMVIEVGICVYLPLKTVYEQVPGSMFSKILTNDPNLKMSDIL